MPWIDIAANVGSTLLGSLGGNDAAEAQRRALAEAKARKEQALARGEQLQQPYAAGGADAFEQLLQRLPQLTQGYDPSRLTSEPGYQFGLNQGQTALERSLAASGLGVSGSALKQAARYGTDYATTKLNDAFNRDRLSRNDAFSMLQGVGNTGQRAAESLSGLNERTADSIGSDILGGGNAEGANDIAQGNIWGNLLNQGASTWKNRKTPGGGGVTGGGGFGTGANFGNQDYGLFLADGGRVEPRIGSRTPLPSSGAGGLSREAVLAALDAAASQPVATTANGMAVLPADPLRNPRAITEDRLRKAGAYADGGMVKRKGCATGGAVHSKAGGKADTVKANLSGGEHVFDAEVVAMLGDGNSEAGHRLLEELKRKVREFKRATPAGKPAPTLELETTED